MTVAVRREMTPEGAGRLPDADTLFMCGTPPGDADEWEPARFGQRRNHRIVFPSFNPGNAANRPAGLHASVTHEIAETSVPSGDGSGNGAAGVHRS